MESGLSAAIDTDCSTFMGLNVISRATLKDLLAKHLICQIPLFSHKKYHKIVAFILPASSRQLFELLKTLFTPHVDYVDWDEVPSPRDKPSLNPRAKVQNLPLTFMVAFIEC